MTQPSRRRETVQAHTPRLLRGEMDSFVRGKFDDWTLRPAERDIAMNIPKGLGVAQNRDRRGDRQGAIPEPPRERIA